jgi:type IV secretory pathway TraG/TraD family ATPase VirD4
MFLGEIGAGKTNAIQQLIQQIRRTLKSNDIMFIFDTKGDFYREFYRKGDIVISNDNSATGSHHADFWNIFREVGIHGAAEDDIMEIAKSLFYERIQRASQPFFPNAAKDLFSAIMLHFHRVSADSSNNEQLRQFFNSATPANIREILIQHDDLKTIVSYIGDDRSPQTQGVVSELQQMVREIFVGNFRRPGTISIRQSVRRKGGYIVFIEYDLAMGNVLTPIYRLMIDLAIKEALGRSTSEGNVWFIIDEFRLIPNLQHIDDGVNFGRSLGAKFVIGIQNIEQVFHAYTEPLARSILSGFLTTIAFRVNDPATRSFVQELFGKNRVYEATPSRVGNKGLMEQVRDANVVEDWDILRLRTGQALIGLPQAEPFLFQFGRYQPQN